MVSLADGRLISLRQDTGDTLWTFEAGGPLVSSANPRSQEVSIDGSEAALPAQKDILFPGTDGSLYVYRPVMDGSSSPGRIEKLPVSVRDLVTMSPAPSQDGSVVLGSQRTTVFLIQRDSGELLKTLIDFNGDLNTLREDTIGDDDPLVIGRKDYVVRSVHPKLGEQWNMTWSQLQRLSELEIVVGTPHTHEYSLLPEELKLGSDYKSLKRVAVDSGWEIWQKSFGVPPIAAYTQQGARIDLLGVAKSGRQTTRGGTGNIVVGMMGSSIYAIPTELLGPQSYCSSSAHDARQCDLVADGDARYATEQQDSKALTVAGTQQPESCEYSTSDGETCEVPLGVFPIFDGGEQDGGEQQPLLLLPAPAPPETPFRPLSLKIRELSGLTAGLARGTIVLFFIVIAIAGWILKRQMSFQRGEKGLHQRRYSELPNGTAVQAGLINSSLRAARSTAPNGAIRVGRMLVGPGILGYGSGGTMVFQGELDGRPVAVKRLLRQFYDLAQKEIKALILSDEHPNVVRCFAMEEDDEFVYLALERCVCSLNDILEVHSAARSKTTLPPLFAQGKNLFVDSQGSTTPYAVKIAHDIGKGLEALHSRGVVHRDLKPHNVLLTMTGVAKLSDMGLSKKLASEAISFESVGSGGSSGWQAPEQLVSRSGGTARQTLAVDVFSYGLLVHYILTGGKHPFGEHYERDGNIMGGRCTLKTPTVSEATNLLQGMLAHDPARRPVMKAILAHPVWWSCPRSLSFLISVSDRVEGEDRAEDTSRYAALEALKPYAVGDGSWAVAMDSALIENLGKYRRYDTYSLRDLLRVIRNKHNHFREMPSELQSKLGPIPEGFMDYFSARYPGLLTACFYFALKWCREEASMKAFFPEGSEGLLITTAPEAALGGVYNSTPSTEGEWVMRKAGITGPDSPVDAYIGSPPQQLEPRPPSKYITDPIDGTCYAIFPSRPGHPVCDFFQKTGHCKYGDGCRFDHPAQYAVKLSRQGLPLRPDEPPCGHFTRNGDCKFGAGCKFDHGSGSAGGINTPVTVKRLAVPPGYETPRRTETTSTRW